MSGARHCVPEPLERGERRRATCATASAPLTAATAEVPPLSPPLPSPPLPGARSAATVGEPIALAALSESAIQSKVTVASFSGRCSSRARGGPLPFPIVVRSWDGIVLLGVVRHRRVRLARPSGHARAEGALRGVQSIHVGTLQSGFQHAFNPWTPPPRPWVARTRGEEASDLRLPALH